MNAHPRMKTLAACVGIALAQWSGSAVADSAVGVDNALGNALNPPGRTAVPRPVASDGFDTVRHSPTGQLYGVPLDVSGEKSKTEGGWEYSGGIEAGFLTGDASNKSAGFRQYKDLKNGGYLNYFDLEANKPDTASFIQAFGGGAGRNDQFYGLQFGRYNDWKVRAFYTETPHTFTSTYKSIWSGVGTGNLTLNPPLTAGGGGVTTAVSVTNTAAAVAATNDSTLSIVRKKGGVKLDLTLSDATKLYASYSNEKREGARPFGMVAGVGGGGTSAWAMEIPESIDYTTHDFLAGMRYVDGLNALNLSFSASLFRNNIDTQTIQVPFANPTTVATNANNVTSGTGLTLGQYSAGRFDLVPSNDAYNAKAEYARSLPDFYKGRFTAVVALGSSRQNDNLIPDSLNNFGQTAGNFSNITYLTPGALPNWNSTSSLSKQSAGARIDTRLFDLGLAVEPTSDLHLKGDIRRYETKNKTEYLACNPNARYNDVNAAVAGNQPGQISAWGCTGVWGRGLINDGAGASVFGGNSTGNAGQAISMALQGANMPVRNIPFDYKQTNYTLATDYHLTNTSSLNANLEREQFNYTARERTKTWEDKFKIGFVNRGLETGTLRLSAEYDERRGDTYNPNPYNLTYKSGYLIANSGGTITVAAAGLGAILVATGTRRYDLADRRQNIFNARYNYALGADFDAGVSAQVKSVSYPTTDTMGGLNDRQALNSINFDVNYQPATGTTAYAYYSRQEGRLHQGSAAGKDNTALSQAAQPATAWNATFKDLNDVIGAGFVTDIGRTKLGLDYTFSVGKTISTYGFVPGLVPAGSFLATQNALVDSANAGTGFPDMKTIQHVFDATLLVPYDKRTSFRFLYHHESGRIKDWHYFNGPGLVNAVNPVQALGTAVPTLLLDGGPQNYHVNAFGVYFLYKM